MAEWWSGHDGDVEAYAPRWSEGSCLMETGIGVLGALAGLVAGGAVGWLAARARHSSDEAAAAGRCAELNTLVEERSARVTQLTADLEARRRETDQLLAETGTLREAQARLTAELDGERRLAGEKLALLAEAERQLREAFQALSAEALKSNNQSFLDLARAQLGEFQKGAAHELASRQQAIDELVKPIRESLNKVDATLQQAEKDRIGSYSALSEQVKSLAVTQQQLQGETANLVKALRAPAVRGRWGEMQLRRVVELAGMLDHCDFHEQQSVETGDGRLRPDMLVRLPGGKNVVVDAKAPLAAYLEAIEAPEEPARESRLRDHARQVRDHMTKLGGKGYWDQFQRTPEFVVMFLPGETFFSAALQHDPALIEYGVGKKVIPASPITLIALLRAVAYGWRQEQLADNAERISALGKDLYQRIRVMAEHFEGVRRGLDKAVDSYNRAATSLETRVLVAARRFKELGAATEADIECLDGIDRVPRQLQSAAASSEPADEDADREPRDD